MGIDIFFHEELNDLLPLKKRNQHLIVPWQGRRSVKDLVESLCVPHTEVGGIRVGERWVDFSYIVGQGDRVVVFPVSPLSTAVGSAGSCESCTPDNPLFNPGPVENPVFLCDVHLWKLARRLRLLGFDTRFDPRWDDAQLAEMSQKEGFILLTRDRGLLIRRVVERGVYIHNTDPEEQVLELLRRLDLVKRVSPFTRCLVCGGFLEPVNMESGFFAQTLKPQIPPKVFEWTKEYHYCTSCEKVFWKGSHYEKLIAMIHRYTTGFSATDKHG